MIQSTTDYAQFTFRDDNRAAISPSHVAVLKKSIEKHNMLEFRPMQVNASMEIIDGQHRLKAAEQLGVKIYYQVIEDSQPKDLILLNVAKNWGASDYLNYYVKNGYPEYQKMDKFMKDSNLTLRIALTFLAGTSQVAIKKFKEGEFVFACDTVAEELAQVHQTIEFIKLQIGRLPWIDGARVWRALACLVKQHNFNMEKWINNLGRMSQKLVAKATLRDYMELFQGIHNYRNDNKINMQDDE
jgi:hypothetical protein